MFSRLNFSVFFVGRLWSFGSRSGYELVVVDCFIAGTIFIVMLIIKLNLNKLLVSVITIKITKRINIIFLNNQVTAYSKYNYQWIDSFYFMIEQCTNQQILLTKLWIKNKLINLYGILMGMIIFLVGTELGWCYRLLTLGLCSFGMCLMTCWWDWVPMV